MSGGTIDSEITSNRYNTHQHQPANDIPLSIHIKTASTSSVGTTAAPSIPSFLASTQPYIGSGENVQYIDQQHHRSSYNLLSEAMSQAVNNEFSKLRLL